MKTMETGPTINMSSPWPEENDAHRKPKSLKTGVISKWTRENTEVQDVVHAVVVWSRFGVVSSRHIGPLHFCSSISRLTSAT